MRDLVAGALNNDQPLFNRLAYLKVLRNDDDARHRQARGDAFVCVLGNRIDVMRD
jgi:hypothetical protein